MTTTAAILYPKVADYNLLRKAHSNSNLQKSPAQYMYANSNLEGSLCYSFIDERYIAKYYQNEIKYHEESIKSLDREDPEYQTKLNYHTEKLHEARELYEKFNNENRNFGLTSFKEGLKSIGEFIKDIGDKAADLILHKILKIEKSDTKDQKDRT